MKRLIISGLLPLAALSLSGLAQAGGAGSGSVTYLGAAIGASKSSAKTSHLTHPDTCNIKGSTCHSDKSDRAWQIHGGYTFVPGVALEGAYVDLGKTANVSNKGTGGALQGEQKTKGVSLSVVGKAPVGPLSGYGKVGVYRWDSEVSVGGPSAKNKASAKGTSATVGAGLEFPLNSDVTVRAGWDRYFNTGKSASMLSKTGASTLKTDVDVYSIGVVLNF